MSYVKNITEIPIGRREPIRKLSECNQKKKTKVLKETNWNKIV